MSDRELRHLRHRLGMTQVRRAARLGCAQGHLCDMELGRREVSSEIEARLAELTFVPSLCGRCLCFVGGAGLPCGCRERAA